MQNKTKIHLPKKIRELLALHINDNSMTVEDIVAITDVLKYADTPEETEVFFVGLAELYPAIKEYVAYQEGLSHIAFEQEIKNIIPKLIAQNPKLATEVMRQAQIPGMTMERIRSDFPTISSLLS